MNKVALSRLTRIAEESEVEGSISSRHRDELLLMGTRARLQNIQARLGINPSVAPTKPATLAALRKRSGLV